MDSNRFDLIVVGAGLSGMTAAATGAARGLRVAQVFSGFGMFVFGAGSIGRQPLSAIETPDLRDEALTFFREFTRQAGCPFEGDIDGEARLPTVLGSFQSVSMAPSYVWSGIAGTPGLAAVVGIEGLSSFDADFVAERLNAEAGRLGLATAYTARRISLPHEAGVTPGTLHFANSFDRDPAFRAALLAALKPIAMTADLIIIPGLLGQRTGTDEIEQFRQELGTPICELPTLPPSVPGLRLFHALERRLRRDGVEFFSGFPVTSLLLADGHCDGVEIATPARPRRLSASSVILASGQFSGRLLGRQGSGFDDRLRPLDETGGAIGDNLYAAGAFLSAPGEHGGNQRAILTGYRAGMLAVGQEGRHATR
ncbi:MAG: FAD-binding protein [Telmatospirillum sp.]|nr:FAD-binding protein [Telmatospirillum sp.]